MESKNILIIGNGGREYAIALALRKDKSVGDIFFSPPSEVATLRLGAKNIACKDYDDLLDQILTYRIYLVIIGPEAPIVDGLSDFLRKHKILTFAPSQQNARLEASKAFMKSFVSSLNIPTARYLKCDLDSINEGFEFIDSLPSPYVLKASGLCGGKGVLILDSKALAKERLESMLRGEMFGESGKEVVIEEFLDGYELSIFALSQGGCTGDFEDYIILPPCQDHKKLYDGNKGPNTGGMGAYTSMSLPHRIYNEELEIKIKQKILTPTFKALRERGDAYSGVLFAGIMVVSGEPYLLEYNVRFGDPECEVLMPLFKTPVFNVLESYARGNSIDIKVEFESLSAVCVVISTDNYARDSKDSSVLENHRDDPTYPAKITFKQSLDSIDSKMGHYIFANVSVREGQMYANNNARVLVCVGLGSTIKEARENAYKLAENVEFSGMHFRRDIAFSAMGV